MQEYILKFLLLSVTNSFRHSAGFNDYLSFWTQVPADVHVHPGESFSDQRRCDADISLHRTLPAAFPLADQWILLPTGCTSLSDSKKQFFNR